MKGCLEVNISSIINGITRYKPNDNKEWYKNNLILKIELIILATQELLLNAGILVFWYFHFRPHQARNEIDETDCLTIMVYVGKNLRQRIT